MIQRKDAKFFLKLSLSFFLFLSITGYAYLKTKDYIKGVKISINIPDTSLLTASSFDIQGKITKSSAVFLNDRKIFLDENGNFNEKLILLPGYNIITVRAEDRFKRQTEKKLELVYNPEINQ